MEHTESVISFLLQENILAEKELAELVESCSQTGKSLVSLLKNILSQTFQCYKRNSESAAVQLSSYICTWEVC